ncbi:glycosyltransferase [uncultured Imperialibacter sp.]|uniref:glycosyltransferase n=1 Tax=uncultured Imperialibacter sp. TaxID=1672639 RepID=UPI0030D74D82|tara:strand:+ start:22332 stop:23429 length:1098 start_codon:yes stop_codon:yes gene_type:complete
MVVRRICLVIHSLQAGGMERVMTELANYFGKEESVSVDLVLYGVDREVFYPVPPNVQLHVPPFAFNNKFRAASTIRTLFFLRSKVKKLAPCAVLSFGELWNSFVLIALFGLPFHVFVSDRSQPDKSLGKIHDRLRRWLYPGATGVIAQTHIAAEIYSKMYKPRHLRVIGNPIREIPLDESLRKKDILMVGRLIQSKHQDQLIEIFATLEAKEWRLILIGEDHLKQSHMARLKELASTLGVADCVEFLGKRSDVDQFYRTSSIFAFTSSSEGFPNVIGEALASGLPVVCYDCVAGPSEMIRDGYNGFLIPLFHKEVFAAKLQELVNDSNLRQQMSENARESMAPYSIETIGKKYYDFLLSPNIAKF